MKKHIKTNSKTKKYLLGVVFLITISNYLYLFLFNKDSIKLSAGFWGLIIWIIFVIIGGGIYALGIKSVIKRDDLPQTLKDDYQNIDLSTCLIYILILSNLPCWYFLRYSPIVYLPMVILILATLIRSYILERNVMNDNDIKRNIIVSVIGLVLILALLIFEIFSFSSDIEFYHLIMLGFMIIILIALLIESLKERKKRKKLLQELDDELKEKQ
ncbi:hypothetical protein [Lactococcus lactis]